MTESEQTDLIARLAECRRRCDDMDDRLRLAEAALADCYARRAEAIAELREVAGLLTEHVPPPPVHHRHGEEQG